MGTTTEKSDLILIFGLLQLVSDKLERQPTAQKQRIVADLIATRAIVIADTDIESEIVDIL